MSTDFVVYIEQDEDGRFIGSIPSLSSCYAEGETQEEMMNNLQEVISLCLRNTDADTIHTSHFIGIQTFSFPHAKTRSHSSKKTYQNIEAVGI